jgi:hypothetical protein
MDKSLAWYLKPAAWFFYFVIVFEILFMISPLALTFYSAYGPVLNALNGSAATAWLTRFFLPHFSESSRELFNASRGMAFALIYGGGILFLAAALPLYVGKILRKGPVVWGFYRYIRHPQYIFLAIVGLGTCLLWPRFLVALAYVTMIFLYTLLARWEEGHCEAKFGRSYMEYLDSTGMFLPRALERKLPRFLPRYGGMRIVVALAIYVGAMAGTFGIATALQGSSISSVSGYYAEDVAVLSPARLDRRTLEEAYWLAADHEDVRRALESEEGGAQIVYVVPMTWHLPDIPLEKDGKGRGHATPVDFDPVRFRVLFTRARIHDPDVRGRDIVRTAHGRDPLLVVHVDLAAMAVTRIDDPPEHVRWGDIPTPII